MKRISKFHKVRAERFMAEWKDTFPETAEYTESGRDRQDSDRDPCGDGAGLGPEMLSEEWTGLQISSAAQ